MTSYMLCCNISGTGRKGEIRTVIARHEAIHTADSPDCFTAFAKACRQRRKVSEYVGKSADNGGKVSEYVGKSADNGGKVFPHRGKSADSGGKVSPHRGKSADSGGKVSPHGGKSADSGGKVSPVWRELYFTQSEIANLTMHDDLIHRSSCIVHSYITFNHSKIKKT
jgi:hypothetical protein